MILALDCIELMAASLCLTMGIIFFAKETSSNHIKFIVLLMSISVFLTCAGYSIMSLWPDLRTAFIPRNFGILGIELYLCCLILFVVTDLQFSRRTTSMIHIIICILTIVDISVFGHVNANTYVKLGDYTSYVINELPRHLFHYGYSLIMVIMCVSFAIAWYRKARYKRERTVFKYLLTANIIVGFGFGMDYLFSSVDPSNPSFIFCACMATAFFVFYRACNKNNILTTIIKNIQGDIFTSANVALFAYDYNQHLVLCSPYARETFNLREDEEPLPDDLFDISKRFRARLFETCTDNSVFSYKLRSKDGARIFTVSCKAKLDQYGEPLCLILTANDVTREDELVSQAYEASRAKTQFLAQMSHEIRTPINTILGMNEMIQRETREGTTRRYSQDINVAGSQLLSIINDILDLSKIENNKLEIIPVEYNLVDLINDITKIATPLAEKKGLDLFLTTDASLPSRLYGDDVRIKQIFTNLLSNAVKYTPQGSVSIIIKAIGEEKNNIRIHVDIKDTGMGIRSEDIPKLFESFTRLNEGLTKHIQGTGLGIPIVNSLLGMMGSKLKVQSAVNKGSTFSFELLQGIVDRTPIKDIHESKIAKPSSTTKHIYAEGAKVLIVDDNEMNLKVLQLLLKRNGINPDMAMSGAEAISFAEKNTYHIIFLDHMMPDMDGIETFHNMKMRLILKNDPAVVALTANAIAGAREMYLNEGFNDYMSKPINVGELESILGKYLPYELVEYRADTGDISFDDELDDLPICKRFVDYNKGKKLCGGNEAVYNRLLSMFVDNGLDEKLVEAYKNSDWESYRIITHTLKSNLRSLGADEMGTHAENLELSCRDDDIPFVMENHELFLQQLRDVYEEIREHQSRQ